MRARSLRTALARFVLRTFDEGEGFTHFLFAGDVARLEALADVTRVATGVIAPATSFDAHRPLLAMAEEAFPRIAADARATRVALTSKERARVAAVAAKHGVDASALGTDTSLLARRQLLRQAWRLERLAALDAPPLVLENERRMLAEAIAENVTLAPPSLPDFEDAASIVTDDPYWEAGRRPVLLDASDVFLVALLGCLDKDAFDRGAGAIARSAASRAARRLALVHGFATADAPLRAEDDGAARGPCIQLALRRFAMATYGDDGAVSLLVDAEIPD